MSRTAVSARNTTMAPVASAGAERRGREGIDWAWVKGWLVGAGMMVAMALYIVSWPPNAPPGLNWEGHWSETSYGFDLTGGTYAVAWQAPCPLEVQLWRGGGDLDQVIETPGQVTIPEGSWFWSVRGDCDWTVRLDAVHP